VPHQAFLCQDQRYIALGVVSEDQWPRFCRAVQLEDLADDPRFCINSKRVENRPELLSILKKRFKSKPIRWWIIRLSKEKVPHGMFLDFETLRYHPQVVANEYIVEIDTPHWGRLYSEGLPWKFSAAPAGPIRPGGLVGEHTAQVLAELALAEKQ
jgi:crotonobetainyl-CoA:carnitine CoA-transferase CaiB-like acyl-CoA transferase